jgi:hypothetical protein
MYKKLFFVFLVSLMGVSTAVAELVAYYPLNEGAGTTAADASGKNHNGTIQGTPTWVDGPPGYGKALYFNGQNPASGWVNCGTWNPSAGTGQLSVAFWARWDGSMGSDQWQGLVGKRDDWDSTGAGTLSMWEIEVDATTNVVHFFRGGSYPSSGNYVMPVGQWVHIAVTFNGSTAIFYANGTQTGSGSFSFGPKTDAIIEIGCDSGVSGWNSFNGTLDEVRLYNNALTPAEIKALAAKYGASNPKPLDGEKVGQTSLALSWTAGAFADSHHVFFGDNYDAVYNGTASTDKGIQPLAVTFYWAPDLQIGKTYYWRIDEVSATHPASPWRGAVWSFTIPPKTAWQPNPADGAKYVDTSATLSWSAGLGGILHHVYLGASLDAVKNADTSDTTGIYRGPQGTLIISYTPPTLAFNTDYYWRVDEFDGVTPMNKGPVWSFTTTPPGLGTILREVWEDIGGDAVSDLTGNPKYPDNPSWSDKLTVFDFWDLGLDNYGGRLRGWLHVPVAGDYTFWIASDNGSELWLSSDDDPANAQMIAAVPGANWTGHYEWEKFPEQKSAPITLASGRYYIEALMKEGAGGDGVAVAWQGPAVPTREVIKGTYLKPFEALWALGPKPSNRATDVSQMTSLSWKPGEKAAKHDVYLGTNEQSVANAGTTTAGIYRGRQNLDATTYVPPEAPLEWAKTYYWRIDEVNDLEPASPWQGTVWSFTTANFIVVDDFEQYTDDVANRIFRTWLDGWGYTEPAPGYGGNGTGSAVGYGQAPFAEQTIVHSGKQSMPLAYDNSGTGGKARYSETQREWTTPQDWTTKGVKALTLWFHGDPNNSAEPLYVAVKDSLGRTKVVTYANPNAAMSNNWQEWNIDMKELVSAGLNLASVKTMYIGLGNRVTPKAGGKGTIYIDDIRLYLPRCIASVLKPAADLSGNCVVDYLDLQIIANNWLATATAPNDAKLVAHYTLDGNFNDSSSYTGLQNGDPRNGAAIISDPVRGQVAHFDGVDDYVDCGTFSPSAATGKLSITVWMKWAGPNGGWQGVIGKRDAWTDTDTMWCIEVDRDSSDCRFFQYNSWPEHGINVPPIGEWQHFAVSFDGTNAALYINGESIGGSQPFVFGPKTDARVVFGACEQNGGNPFNGDLDEIRIYDYALSAAEVFYLAEPAVDLNNDNKVNFADFAILADAWLDELLWPQP